jgi:hypothetical protein
MRKQWIMLGAVLTWSAVGAAACSSSTSGGGSPGVDSGVTDSAVTSDVQEVETGVDAQVDSPAVVDSGVEAAIDAPADAPLDAPINCLSASLFSTFFTISDPAFCAVAVYTAPEALASQPSWGSHGGPLVLQADATGSGVTLERWTAPSGAMGTMTKQTTAVAAGVPTGAYLNAQANDLPFFGWTSISWTGPGSATTGPFEMIASGGTVATSYSANGPYWAAGVPAASSLGRFLYTGLSPLGAPTMNTAGLYAADACSSPMQELGAGTGCSASTLIDTWDEYAGPIVTDANNDLFAVMTSATAGNQEARGYIASSIARGAPAVTGTTLFTVDGYSGSLAALVPTTTDPGLVVFQPIDATTNDPLNVIEQQFTATGSIAAMGTPTTLLTVPAGASQGLAIMTDDSQRLWVAGSGTSTTTYVVLVRQH